MSDTITEPTDNTLGNIVQHAMYPPGTEGSRTWPEIGASLRETLTKADLRIIPAAPVQPDEVLAAIADELERQARRVERLATTHSAGLPHGWCVRCETWRAVAAGLCREAAKMRAQMRSRATREHDDAHEPARTETGTHARTTRRRARGRHRPGRADARAHGGVLMGAKTGIEWTDATWNPVTGCTQVSPGCDSCYALTLAERFRGTEGHYYEHGFDLQLRPDKLDQPLRWQKPRRIFVNSMSDLFHEQIPDEYIARVFAVMAASRRHTFQVLTKRHGRMRSLLSADHFTTLLAKAHLELPKHQRGGSLIEYPLPNVWLGVSVENQKWANIRIPALLQTPAEIRFLSMEPLLGPVDLTRVEWSEGGGTHLDVVNGLHGIPGAWQAPAKSVDWAIVGGESGRDARPMHPQWVRSLRDQCVAAGVPYLFKQWGEWQDGSAAPGQSGEDHIIVRDGRHERASDHWAEDARGWWTSDLIKARNTREKGSEDATYISRVGKKAAGRELDGETWDQYPAAVDSTPIRETL